MSKAKLTPDGWRCDKEKDHLLRAKWLDFRSPAIHQLTMVSTDRSHLFGKLVVPDSDTDRAFIDRTPLGDKIAEEIERIPTYIGANGTIYITAAISEGEKTIARTLREAGYTLIILLENGFPRPDDPHYKYFKPQGVYFEACAAGRLLLVEPSPALLDRPDIAAQVTTKAGDLPHTSKRYRFLALNALAAEIAGK